MSHKIVILVGLELIGLQMISSHFAGTCSRTYPTGDGLVCRVCPAGSFLKNHCVSNNSMSDCQPCPTGQHQPNCNVAISCAPCYPCERHGAIVQSPCTATQNTQCVCPQGTYYQNHSSTEGLCITHTTCPIGSGVIVNGTAWQDTVCAKCDGGTFSDTDSFDTCHPCSICDAYVSQCTITADVRCDNVTSQPKEDVTEKSGLSLAGQIVIGFTTAAVIITVVIVVIVYRRRNNRWWWQFALPPERGTNLPATVQNPHLDHSDLGKDDDTVTFSLTGENGVTENGHYQIPNGINSVLENGHAHYQQPCHGRVERDANYQQNELNSITNGDGNGQLYIQQRDPNSANESVEQRKAHRQRHDPNAITSVETEQTNYKQLNRIVSQVGAEKGHGPTQQRKLNVPHDSVEIGQAIYHQCVQNAGKGITDRQPQNTSSTTTDGFSGHTYATHSENGPGIQLPATQNTMSQDCAQPAITDKSIMGPHAQETETMQSLRKDQPFNNDSQKSYHPSVTSDIDNGPYAQETKAFQDSRNTVLQPATNATPHAQDTKANYVDVVAAPERQNNAGVTAVEGTDSRPTVTDDNNMGPHAQATETIPSWRNDKLCNNAPSNMHQPVVRGENNFGLLSQQTEAFQDSHHQHNYPQNSDQPVAPDGNNLARQDHESQLLQLDQHYNNQSSGNLQPATNATPHAQDTKANYVTAVAAPERQNNAGVTAVGAADTLQSNEIVHS